MNSLTSSAAAVDSRQSSYNQKNAIAAAASPVHNAWENWVYFFPLSKHGGVSVKVRLACKYLRKVVEIQSCGIEIRYDFAFKKYALFLIAFVDLFIFWNLRMSYRMQQDAVF